MEDLFYVDTGKLSGHAVIIREERNLAIELRDKLRYLKSFYLPGEGQEIQAMEKKAIQLVSYFSSAADTIEKTSWDFQRLSNEISRILQENESIAGKLIE